MQLSKTMCVLLALGVLLAQPAAAQVSLGAQAAEGDPDRRQQWLLPSPDSAFPAHAILFRPPGEGPFPLAIVAHATSQNVLRRAQMPQPEYRALAAWLVARGFAVLVPERPGHGATGGRYLEDQGGCDEADYARAGRATADSIAAVLDFMRGQSFVRRDGAVIVGHSAGAWGALALAGRNPPGVSVIIAFAPAPQRARRASPERTLLSTIASVGYRSNDLQSETAPRIKSSAFSRSTECPLCGKCLPQTPRAAQNGGRNARQGSVLSSFDTTGRQN